MTTPNPLRAALGALVEIPQFFAWRLDWDAANGKYHKEPSNGRHRIDAQQPHHWMPYEAACAHVVALDATAPEGVRYALGWMFTADCGYWFLDIDACVTDGAYSPLAQDWLARLPGCFFEFSSSGRGVHVIGRDTLAPHSSRNKPCGAELYTQARGIAFGLSGEAWGCADTSAPWVHSLAAQYFPPRASGEDSEWLQPRADWAGPADDAELLRRMLASSSVGAKLGSRATFAQLWANAPELETFYGPDSNTERDGALAAHLAFWTGCDAPRMERLMRASGLARAKWDEHRTYLRELTIHGACARQGEVLHDRPRVDVQAEMYGVPQQVAALAINSVALPALPVVTPALVVPPEVGALVDQMLSLISSASDWMDVHNRVIPTIRAAGIPPALMPRVENAVNKRLELWDAKLQIGKLRALLNPPRVAADAGDGLMLKPEWAEQFVYVQQADCFFDLRDGTSISRSAFGAQFDRLMPIKGDGPARQEAAMYMLQHWGTPVVHDTMYHPARPPLLQHEGRQWANLYTPSSVPALAEYTEDGVAAINRFLKHLILLCGQRERVYNNLICWMAHNVQFPGKKIRWMPIIKGIHGDGKSTVAKVMQAAMGSRNAIAVGPEIVCNTGGFTDWAHGHAFLALEEIHVTGRERYKVLNMLKPLISNNEAAINPKGAKPKKVINTCNQLGLTNHSDGMPIEDTDRRFFVIFSPFGSLAQMFLALGITQARQHFDVVYDSLEREPGQWRKWLMEFQIPEWFDADGSAMLTDEKEVMSESGADDFEAVVRNVIATGAPGVSAQVVSSACLSAAVRQAAFAESVDVPKNPSYHHIMNRAGFVRVRQGQTVHWDGKSHRVWLKTGIAADNEVIRQLLDATKKG